MTTQDKAKIVSNLITLRECCEEALRGDWDRSDDGFEDMRDGIEQLIVDVLDMETHKDRED